MRLAGRVGVVVLAAAVIVGCGGPAPTLTPTATAVPSTGPSAAPSAAAPSDSPDPSLGLDPCADPAASLPPDATLEIDPGLLDLLPGSVDGVVMRPCPAAVADIVDPPVEVEAMAIGLYPGSDGIAVATVSRIRPGVVDADWFRAWRDSIDADVCERAGGVDVGRSQLEIGTLLVHRATCVEGVATYHAQLPGDVVVFVQGTLPGDLGGRVMESLAD